MFLFLSVCVCVCVREREREREREKTQGWHAVSKTRKMCCVFWLANLGVRTKRQKSPKVIKVECCVFRPAFGCCAHPKAGRNIFFRDCLIFNKNIHWTSISTLAFRFLMLYLNWLLVETMIVDNPFFCFCSFFLLFFALFLLSLFMTVKNVKMPKMTIVTSQRRARHPFAGQQKGPRFGWTYFQANWHKKLDARYIIYILNQLWQELFASSSIPLATLTKLGRLIDLRQRRNKKQDKLNTDDWQAYRRSLVTKNWSENWNEEIQPSYSDNIKKNRD